MCCVTTSHILAKELLNTTDCFLTATIGEKEYVIDGIKRTKTHANIDDEFTYLTLLLRDGGDGNIKR